MGHLGQPHLQLKQWKDGPIEATEWGHIRATKPESFTSSLHRFFLFFRLCMSGPGGMLASLNTGSPGETTVGQNLLTNKAGLFTPLQPVIDGLELIPLG